MKLKKAIILFCAVGILNMLAAGCSSGSEPAAKTEEAQADETLPEELSDAQLKSYGMAAEESQETAAGKWQVLEPETAAAVDADFIGKVWKIEEDSFFIAEKKVQILEDGSLAYSSPSSSVEIPDAWLIHVVFDDDTCFYMRSSAGNGEGYEDKEAGFQDLEQYMSVEMKGSFKNDEFHATEIRLMASYKAEEEITTCDPITGAVEKYEGNIMTVRDPADEMLYYFHTENAQILEGFSTESAQAAGEDFSVAVGDNVEVSYKGLLGGEEQPGEALKIVVVPIESAD